MQEKIQGVETGNEAKIEVLASNPGLPRPDSISQPWCEKNQGVSFGEKLGSNLLADLQTEISLQLPGSTWHLGIKAKALYIIL